MSNWRSCLFTAGLVFLQGVFLFAQNSVLSEGDWYKIEVSETGIYKIDYDFLSDIGLGSVNPQEIKIYGYGGIVPQANSEAREGDLVENSIYFYGEEDGSLDQGDYILFFAEGPDNQYADGTDLVFEQNPYTDDAYYFITHSSTSSNRISDQDNVSFSGEIYTELPYLRHFEEDLNNVVKSGRQWVGESFQYDSDADWDFTLSNRLSGTQVDFTVQYVGGAANEDVSFTTSLNGTTVSTKTINDVDAIYGTKARTSNHTFSSESVGNSLNISAVFDNKGDFSGVGYLSFIEILYQRTLNGSGSSWFLITEDYYGTSLQLSNVSSNTMFWDVTSIDSVKSIDASATIGIYDDMERVAVVNSSSALTPNYIGQVENQNLRGMEVPELLIVTNKRFESTAQNYLQFKDSVQGISTAVVYIDEVYNEFSSGRQDVSAIRDLAKHLYDQNAGFGYLLLLGDCSYDYKENLEDNTNFVPVYQSRQSFHNINTYSSDDYFGFMELDEGTWVENTTANEDMDIGVGRIPIQSNTQGDEFLEKIKHYLYEQSTYAGWRNNILFVADDEDNNTHVNHANEISSTLAGVNPSLNITKLYVDAYEQVSSSSGKLAPDVNDELLKRIENGLLIVNFTGHGSETQWTQEEILTVNQISSLDNFDKLPFFITATCEFGRYDDPSQESGAEELLFNPNGGAIGLMTTTRPVYAEPNKRINLSFYNSVFDRDENNELYYFGEVFRKTKNETSDGTLNRNFSLLGDPTMKLGYAENFVSVDSINGVSATEMDTLSALESVEVKGRILDASGEFDSTFSGTMQFVMFDKTSTVTTLGTDVDSYPITYEELSSIVFSGEVDVVDGEYTVNFIVPKDISYTYGTGKMSLFAYNSVNGESASGFYSDAIIGGGISDFVDDTPPEVQLFINDTTFVSGGISGSDPVFIAKVFDESGINTTNTGIGHEMTLIIDDNEDDIYILNDFYSSVGGSFMNGEIEYNLYDLSVGLHKLTFKVWDVNNNSTQEEIYVEVDNLGKVFPVPNPFTDQVSFVVEQPRVGESGTVQLVVFDALGQEVYIYEVYFDAYTASVNDLIWDGSTSNGEFIESGIYLAYVSVRYDDNESNFVEKHKVILQN